VSGFQWFANRIAALSSNRWPFVIAVTVVAIWAGSGRYFDFSDTWHLVVNTGTTIVTFVTVFLIQNTHP
jgi:low affinity Fe/Cu permease